MQVQDLIMDVLLLLIGYLVGSIPFGLIVIKLKTGKDIRSVESGRTGGANAMRAGGLSAGVLTAVFDVLKGAVVVWVAQALAPGNAWAHILAPIGAILGHNYSLYLPEFDENRRFLRFRGGAGAAPALGGAIGLWGPSLFIIVPIGMLAFFVFGYASLTTISVGVSTLLIFGIPALLGQPGSSWINTFYGAVALALLVWALIPNIQKLMNGTERVIGMSLHGKMKAKREKQIAENRE